MAKVNTLSSDVQRSNSDIFSVKPMESHGEMINAVKLSAKYLSSTHPHSEFPFIPQGKTVVTSKRH